jgi:methyl-accepting chemotaxis protein
VAASTRSTTASVEESRRAANDLAEVSGRLQAVAAQFRL